MNFACIFAAKKRPTHISGEINSAASYFVSRYFAILIPEQKTEHGLRLETIRSAAFPIDKPPSKEGPWPRQEDGCYQMHLAAKWRLFLHLVPLFWAGKHWNCYLKFGWNSHWLHSGCFFSDWNRKWMVPSLSLFQRLKRHSVFLLAYVTQNMSRCFEKNRVVLSMGATAPAASLY